MLLALLALACGVQEKTAEQRVAELERRFAELEKRHQAALEENRQLERTAVEVETRIDTLARQQSEAWIKRYGKAAELSEIQSAEIGEIMSGWFREDLKKAPDAAKWKSREEALRGRLSDGQATRLAAKVAADQKDYVKLSAEGFVKAAGISAERSDAFQKAIAAKVVSTEGAILPQAHPEARADWFRVHEIVGEILPDLAGVLHDDEHARLRDVLEKWKPRVPGKR